MKLKWAHTDREQEGDRKSARERERERRTHVVEPIFSPVKVVKTQPKIVYRCRDALLKSQSAECLPHTPSPGPGPCCRLTSIALALPPRHTI